MMKRLWNSSAGEEGDTEWKRHRLDLNDITIKGESCIYAVPRRKNYIVYSCTHQHAIDPKSNIKKIETHVHRIASAKSKKASQV